MRGLPTYCHLIQSTFAYMAARIDPPSSMTRLTEAAIREQCRDGEVWVIGDPPRACVFLEKKPGVLYLGKLTVAEAARGQGLARRLAALAEARARALALPVLELETRLSLPENIAVFERLGFERVGLGRHEGYDRPTFVIMRKPA